MSDGTPPFYTFDPFDATGIDNLLTVLDSASEEFYEFIEKYPLIASRISEQGIENPADRDSISWDDANLIFVATKPPESVHYPPFTQGNIRDRMGRIPFGDGDAIGYLIMFLKPPSGDEGMEMMHRISMLHSGFSSSLHGHNRFSHGRAGMCLRGFLSLEDVQFLQHDLRKLQWSVSADEPLDGGVRTIVKDLHVILRRAAKQGSGLLLRSHS